MTDYDYDDPDRERGAVVGEWRKAGFPASVPIGLLDHLTADGMDPIEACRQVMGALAIALDPELDRLLAAASAEETLDDDEVNERLAGRHEYQLWILDACRAHISDEELLAIRHAWKESIGEDDLHRDAEDS